MQGIVPYIAVHVKSRFKETLLNIGTITKVKSEEWFSDVFVCNCANCQQCFICFCHMHW